MTDGRAATGRRSTSRRLDRRPARARPDPEHHRLRGGRRRPGRPTRCASSALRVEVVSPGPGRDPRATRRGRARRWRGRRLPVVHRAGRAGRVVGGSSCRATWTSCRPGDPGDLDRRPVGRRGPRRPAVRPRRLRHEGRRRRDPRRGPGARRRAATLDRLGGELLVVARPVRGGRRPGHARRDPGRRRPATWRSSPEPSNLDIVVAHAGAITFRLTVPGPRGPRLAAARGRLRARQPVTSCAGARGRRDAPERGRDRPADDRPRPAVPDDRRDRRGRRVGIDRARPGRRRRPLRRPARPDRRPTRRPSCGAAIAAACAADAFLRDHPATVEITGGRFGSARVPSDHPLPVGLADVVEAVTGRRPALLGEPYGADMQMFVNDGDTPCVIFGPGDVKVAHSADESRPARRGRGVRPGPRRLGPAGARRTAARAVTDGASGAPPADVSEPGRDDRRGPRRGGRAPRSRRARRRRPSRGWRPPPSSRSAPSVRPWTRVRSASDRPRRQQRRSRDVAQVPAVARAGTGRGTGARRPPAARAAARTAATATMARPARMTGTLPNRSVSRPEIGDSANIPNVWPLITMPTAARSWPWSVMWSGVIVMIRTITTWPVTSATIATGTFGRAQDAGEGHRGRRAPGRRSRAATTSSASSYGSGRSIDERQECGGPDEHASARGTAPLSSGRPRFTARAPAGADEVRSDDRADRRAPDDEADGRGPRGPTGTRSAAA